MTGALALTVWTISMPNTFAQMPSDSLRPDNTQLDSLYIAEVEDRREPDKVLHAEPLFIDLIRDLGARRGEREWNVGLGLTDNLRYDAYQMLVEYEWAPVNRLGLEIEVPVTFYASNGSRSMGTGGHDDGLQDRRPAHRVESLKTALQWSFLVSESRKTTLALGYINELKFKDLPEIGWQSPWVGNRFNPFLIAAKRWGDRYHTLLYTGPRWTRDFGQPGYRSACEINSSFHYLIPGTRNFVGLEVNQELKQGRWEAVARPQLRVSLADNLLMGIVTGIPFRKENQRLSSFLRVIYEPAHVNRRPRRY